MILLSRTANLQVRGFALATIAWILCSTSMSLPQWQVWYLDEPRLSFPNVAFVGMWRACIFHHQGNSSSVSVCHQYTYPNAFIPLDIRVSQHLLLAANVVGFIGTASSIFPLRDAFMERLPKNDNYNPFVLSAVLNGIASSFILLAVLCNYFSVKSKEGVAFLPSFQMPFFVYTQKVGNAMGMASLSSILFLLSAILFISYTPFLDTEVFSEV